MSDGMEPSGEFCPPSEEATTVVKTPDDKLLFQY